MWSRIYIAVWERYDVNLTPENVKIAKEDNNLCNGSHCLFPIFILMLSCCHLGYMIFILVILTCSLQVDLLSASSIGEIDEFKDDHECSLFQIELARLHSMQCKYFITAYRIPCFNPHAAIIYIYIYFEIVNFDSV